MQQGIPGTGHAHGQRQQVKQMGVGRVMAPHFLIAAHAGIVVEIVRTGDAGGGQQQQIGTGFLHGLDGHLELGPMNGLSGLKSHDAVPPQFAEPFPDLGRCQADLRKIRMNGQVHCLDRTADIIAAALAEKIGNAGMGGIPGTIDGHGLFSLSTGQMSSRVMIPSRNPSGSRSTTD